MSRLSASWHFGIRHALIAMTVLATLASTFGFHVHASGAHEHHDSSFIFADEHAADHDCSATSLTGDLTAYEVGDLGTNPEMNETCHCHCQPSVTDLPEMAGNLTSADHIVKLLIPRDELFRVGITYQPDPPPVLG